MVSSAAELQQCCTCSNAAAAMSASEQPCGTAAVLSSLFNHAREAHNRSDVKAIVVTGGSGRFSAGFDIAQFAAKSGGGGIDHRINQARCNSMLQLC